MKQIWIFTVILFLFAGPALAQFEGVVRMKVVSYEDSDSTVIDAVLTFKGKNLASTIQGVNLDGEEGGKYILRGDKKVFWIISDQEKKYVEFPIPESDPAARKNRETSGEADAATSLKGTGRTSKFAGYSCEEWIADDGEGGVATIWATRDLGESYRAVVDFFEQMTDESATGEDRWESKLAAMGLFPIRVTRTEDGEPTEKEEVLSIERMKVSDALFEAPKGYEKQVLDLDYQKMFEEMMKKMGGEDAGEKDSTGDGDGRL